jgi:hypothetical protein
MANTKNTITPKVVDNKSMTSTKNCEHHEHDKHIREEKKWEGEQREKEKEEKKKKITKP